MLRRVFLLLVLLLALPVATAERIAVVVNANLKPLIQANFDRYLADLVAEGYAVESRDWDLTLVGQKTPADLKAWLQSVPGLSGAVLIGDLPFATRKITENFGGGNEIAIFPTDLYFMDLGRTWTDTNADGYFDTVTGTAPLSIWVSRIMAERINVFNGATIPDLVNRYLDKVHAFRTGIDRLPDAALQWSDSDWNYLLSDNTRLASAYAASACTDISELTGFATDRQDWMSRWNTPYETEHFMCHSSVAYHQPSSQVTSAEIAASSIQRLFWNCWNCSSAKFTEANYIAGVRLFTTRWNLLAVGTTKTGSMYPMTGFYEHLGDGVAHGSAFLKYFNAPGIDRESSQDLKWVGGLALLGDGTLRLGRYHAVQADGVAHVRRLGLSLQRNGVAVAATVRLDGCTVTDRPTAVVYDGVSPASDHALRVVAVPPAANQ